MRAIEFRRALLIVGLLLVALAAGGGTITGRILDANGKPLSGSRLLWTAYREDDEVLVEQTQGTTPAALGETKTDETGRFRIGLEKPGVLLALRVVTSGFPEARLSGPYDSGDTVDLGDLHLPAPTKIAGRVLNESGKPLAGARVRILTAGFAGDNVNFLSETRSGADGTFAVTDAPDGPRVVAVRSEGLIAQSRFALEARSEERITMQRGGVVRGTLTDAEDKPVEGAIIMCEDVAARTDATGAYRLTGLPLGSRVVETVWKEEFAARKEAVKVLRDAEVSVPLRLARAAAVTGSVVEEPTRKPVAGVRVSLLNPGRFAFGRNRAQRVVRTDARGRFRVGGLGAHHYTVEASRDGYLPATIQNVAATLISPAAVAIALQRAATVSGSVKDEKGQAVAGARVRIDREPNLRALLRGASPAAVFGQQTTLTGPDGAFVLRRLAAHKSVTLEASKAGFSAARKLGMSWKAGEQVKDVILTLKVGLTAKGKVADAQGQPIAGAQVFAERRDGGRGGRGRGGAGMVIRTAGGQADTPDAVSRTDGTFVVGGLDDGEYTVAVTRDGYAPKTVGSLEVKGPEETRWPTIVLSAGMAVAGAVRNAQGQPIIGAQIFAIGESFGRPRDAVTDGDGRFRIGGLTAERAIMLSVSADGFASAQRTLTPPVEDLAIVLMSTGTVRGRVEDGATHNPVTDFTISRSAGGGGEFGGGFQIQVRNGQISTGTNSFQSTDGSFELTDVPPGKWTIRASASGYRPADISAVEVGEGGTTEGVVFSLKAGGTLTGRVLDSQKGTGVPNASVSWRAQGSIGMGGMGGMGGAAGILGGNTNNLTTTDADGKFSFDGLPDGKVTITASHPDYLDAAANVSPGEQQSMDITLGIGGSISGMVASADGRTPVAGSRVTLNAEGDTTAVANNSTTADGNGAFVFDHLRAGRYSLTATTAAGNAPAKEVILADNQIQSGVILQMITGALVQGNVTGLSAGQLGGVRIAASMSGYTGNTTTDDNGAFSLNNVPTGVLRLTATTSFMQGRSTSQSVEIPDGATSVPVQIVFQGASSLSGRVTQGGLPMGGLLVSALPEGGGALLRFSSQTDGNGSYSIQGMTDGNYQVTVAGQGFSYRKQFTVSGDTPGDIVLPTVSLTGTVVDSTSGQPVVGATVQAETGAETQAASLKRAVTDSNGNYTIDNVDAGMYQVTARMTGYQLQTQSVSVGTDPAQLSFQLNPGSGVPIRVLDGMTGLPLTAVNALAFAANGTIASQGAISLDSAGTGEIASLTQGRYSIYIFSDGYAPRSFPAVDVPAPLLTITMTPGGRVEVMSAVAFTGQLVDGSGALYLLSAFNFNGRVNVQPPSVTWPHVAPGSYQLIVQSSGGKAVFPFTVNEGQTSTVVVK